MPAVAAQPGMCVVPQSLPFVECVPGDSGQLCLSTPPAGIADDEVIVRGTVDLSEGLASLSLSLQHEYTGKSVSFIANRCSGCPEIEGVCLDSDGTYCAKMFVDDYGPFAVTATASFLVGAQTKVTKFSRVRAPDLKKTKVEFSPDPNSNEINEAGHLNITVSLLDDCQFCDFIGSGTGAISITAKNVIESLDSNQEISCSTNVEQGGSGIFAVGLPISMGHNNVEVRLCSPAMEECVLISSVSFGSKSEGAGAEILNPESLPSYSSEDYPEIDFLLKWPSVAEECIEIDFNLEETAMEVCKENDGTFKAVLNPIDGVNTAIIKRTGDMAVSWPWFFGWGSLASPFKEEGWGPSSLASISIPKRILNNLVLPAVNSFLESEEFIRLVKNIGSAFEDGMDSDSNNSKPNIPGCNSDGPSLEIKIAGGISIKRAELKNLELRQDELSLRLVADGVNVPVDLKTNFGWLPLRIGWRRAAIDLIIRKVGSGEDAYFLLTGPYSDCDYRTAPYCSHKPAVLIPRNIAGDGNLGEIFHCDAQRGSISGKLRELCFALENLDAQTGMVHDKILEAMNEMVICSGSSVMSGEFPINLPKNLPPVVINAAKTIQIDPLGIGLDIFGWFGKPEHFTELPDETQYPSVGFIEQDYGVYKGKDLSAGITASTINRAIFVYLLTRNGGMSFDLHESMMEELFDVTFAELCDSGENEDDEAAGLCFLRPRVGELLGSPLSTYGYFDQKQALLAKIKIGNLLPPHVGLMGDGKVRIDAQIGGVSIYFYPVEIDESGEPTIVDWLNNGKEVPIIGLGLGVMARLTIKIEDGKLYIKINESGTKVFLSPLPGTNATTVPDEMLVDALRGKIGGALSEYTSKEAEPFEIEIPEKIDLPDPVSNYSVSLKNVKLEFVDGWLKLMGVDIKSK